MLSYHNDPALKAKFQAHFEQHRAADDVIQGTGFDNGRGCFVGCTLDNYDHSQFPKQLGWPEWLARLADSIFEGVPEAEAPQFGTDLLAAVPVGIDLEPVRFMLAIKRHEIQLARLEGNTEPYAEQVREALRSVIAYCNEMLGTQYGNDRSAARSAARSAESAAEAAWSAARSAARSAESAAEAAWSAAWSARSAAAEAAWSAAWSARSAAEAARSARSAAWQTERDTLLAVLKSLG